MSFEQLGSAIVNTEQLLSSRLTRLASEPGNGETYVQISDDFRVLACGAVLMDLDVDAFSDYLYCSGVTYLELLKGCRDGTVDPYYSWRSHGTPFLDVVAIGAQELAREIEENRPTQPHAAQGEVEEDFEYQSLLGLLTTSPEREHEIKGALQAFEASIGEGTSTRLDVLTSLVGGDATGFTSAFDAFLETWAEEVAEDRAAGRLSPYGDATVANLCVEGLALLRVAESRGIGIRTEYPWIPDRVVSHRPHVFPVAFSAMGASGRK